MLLGSQEAQGCLCLVFLKHSHPKHTGGYISTKYSRQHGFSPSLDRGARKESPELGILA